MSEPILSGPIEVSLRPDGRSYFTTCQTPPPPVEFDGHRFDRRLATGANAPWFYLAYKARRGDAAAVAVLRAMGLVLPTADGGAYWPPAGGDWWRPAGAADAPVVVEGEGHG